MNIPSGLHGQAHNAPEAFQIAFAPIVISSDDLRPHMSIGMSFPFRFFFIPPANDPGGFFRCCCCSPWGNKGRDHGWETLWFGQGQYPESGGGRLR